MKNVTLIIGISCLAGCLLSIGFGSSAEKQDKPGRQVVHALDRMIQSRFMVNAGMFGESRIGINGHMNIEDFQSKSPADRKTIKTILAANRVFTTGFFHCSQKPGKRYIPNDVNPESMQKPTVHFKGPTYQMFDLVGSKSHSNGGDGAPEPVAATWDKRYHEGILRGCISDRKSLLRGKNKVRKLPGMTVTMRPILASKPECVGCHAGAHLNDTLGVMVYTMRDRPRNLQTEADL